MAVRAETRQQLTTRLAVERGTRVAAAREAVVVAHRELVAYWCLS
jgi:hypothetical protein